MFLIYLHCFVRQREIILSYTFIIVFEFSYICFPTLRSREGAMDKSLLWVQDSFDFDSLC